MKRVTAVAVFLVGLTAGADAPPGQTIDPKADSALRQMSRCLADAKAFSFDVHSTGEQYVADGQCIQMARNQKVVVRRPNRAKATVTGDEENFRFFYDGSHAVLFNPDARAYATIDVPDTLDATFDVLAEKYGMTLPLADIVFSDPYKVLTEKVTAGRYVGVGYVFDVRCHHLAFTQEAVDWQIWIDVGDRPLPRKVSITYKQLTGQPRYTAFLSNWNLAADVTDGDFAFAPPSGARQVPWLNPTTRPAKEPAAADAR